ncbi:periplasmic heavy metal sensor [Thiohalomonas denitrificans]|uniref:Signaling pathway modulator ZraP n=1 Tax=Thiohalomonas denitrificans TaxID=415747 RepID=A0A1G5Q0M8_9GAMM|nr:periplasmic heavy metal sensor [Thiohalomonas denitrificans]SCZ54859.1 Heavy-metal resistance [Thiohalomonas denitrificans]
MKRYCLPTLLILSLALNGGVLGMGGIYLAESWFGPKPAQGHAMLVQYLELEGEQRRIWQEKEKGFMNDLTRAWKQIHGHREKMIREIFSDSPDQEFIELQRAAISKVQEQQQNYVIAQMMAEREILDANQRQKLADLLIQQNPIGSLEKVLADELHHPHD